MKVFGKDWPFAANHGLRVEACSNAILRCRLERRMTLVLSNDDAAKVLTMADTITALIQLYADLAES